MPDVHEPPNKRRHSMSSPVVLITGALTGIGRAVAQSFAQSGAHLVVSGRRDLQGLGAEAIFVHADVRNESEVRDQVDQSVARFGRLDAGVKVTEQTAETYAATFDTNVLGTLLSMKHEMRVMLAQGNDV